MSVTKTKHITGDFWWLKKDCWTCRDYDRDCPFIERNVKKPRGCSAYRDRQSSPVTITEEERE